MGLMPKAEVISPSSSYLRRLDLDWLRTFVFGLLILSHIGMYYGTENWVIKSEVTSPAVDVLQYLARPWRLMLLFIISGSATAFLLAKLRHGFLRERSRRLLVPLVFAILVIIPLQRYYQAIEHAGYAGGYAAFLGSYLTFGRDVCGPSKCYDVPTLSHLWFVAYLWIFTVLLWTLIRLRPGIDDQMRRLLAAATSGSRVLVWPMLLLIGLRLLLRDAYPPTFNFMTDWYRDIVFFLAFAFGFLVAREHSIWASIRQTRWPALGLWLGSYLILAWTVAVRGVDRPPIDGLHYLGHVAYGVGQWSGVVAVLGFASGIAFRDSDSRKYFTDAIFPFYIVHYAAIIVIAVQLRTLALPVALEAVLLISGTVLACVTTYAMVRRVQWLRPLFGLRKVPTPVR